MAVSGQTAYFCTSLLLVYPWGKWLDKAHVNFTHFTRLRLLRVPSLILIGYLPVLWYVNLGFLTSLISDSTSFSNILLHVIVSI